MNACNVPMSMLDMAEESMSQREGRSQKLPKLKWREGKKMKQTNNQNPQNIQQLWDNIWRCKMKYQKEKKEGIEKKYLKSE